MAEQVVPEHLLLSSKKILFITHLTISKFVYAQNYFIAFKRAYPHLAIDLWINQKEKPCFFWRWKYLKKYILFDWVKACPFFNKIYSETYSPFVLKKSLKHAQLEHYDIIVSLTNENIYRSVKHARTINAKAFIIAQKKNYKPYRYFFEQALLKKINGTYSYIATQADQITDIYAAWFQQLFGMHVPQEQRTPFVTIPHTWLLYAKLQFLKWGICKKKNIFARVVLVNPLATTKKQCWALKNVFELLRTIKQNDQWGDITFLINTTPEYAHIIKNMSNYYAFTNVHIISADLNFFQLPAFISISDLVISVETSVIELAHALNVPVVHMPQTNNTANIILQHPILASSLRRKEESEPVIRN